ncbi:Hypothetical predicted protein [Paramuricea clavata]|uniref:Uncharacterized protein n=1 Tax=Paramuricea clavata TaxID=317549 RepID=A0A7D9HPP5_PARCT|nr:Hypothetical predicted protein [Paramuricea clavata]
MGKIRRVRTKRHIEAVKNKTSEDNSNTTEFLPNESNLPALFPVNNLFELAQENAKIDDATDVAQESGKINTEEKLTAKKDKRKLRHEKFLKKLHTSKTVEESCKATKKRQKTVITGDLNPLTQALLDIDKLPVIKPNKKKRSERELHL